MNYFESKEDYLERILMLQSEIGNVRAVDIARDMEFSKPSVSIAMKKLEDKGLVVVEADTGYLNLTDEGREIAKKTYEKHETLTSFFKTIGVNPTTAESDACKIEHDLSDETFECLQKYFLNNK